ncbi:MAG: ADP-ribosylglycohydrolase family protein [Thermoleophilia bacterium]
MELIANEDVLSRAQGSLLGQLAGDSLGGLVEFQAPDAIRARYPNGVRDLADGGTWQTLAGQPTDDSELALALARSLVGADSYRAHTAARAYAGWYRSRPFDIGNATRRSLGTAAAALERREDPEVAAREAADPDTQANGALMRVSPLGIFGWRYPKPLVDEWARADATLTHPHVVCRDANALFAVAIAHAVAEGPTPASLYEFVAEWADPLTSAVRQVVTDAREQRPPSYLEHAGWVLVALQNAFHQLLHADSLEDGLVDTVMAGGDTDTNACIAGSLLGACYGLEAIPDRWREAILACRPEEGLPGVHKPRPPEFWPSDALELAARLVGQEAHDG